MKRICNECEYLKDIKKFIRGSGLIIDTEWNCDDCYRCLGYSKDRPKKIMRVCRKCGDEKDIEKFVKNKGCKYGHSWTCKKCYNGIAKLNIIPRICKIPFCQNIVPERTHFCDEHSEYRNYYRKGYRNICKVNFNICKYCGKLFTSKKSNGLTCKTCVKNNMQSKKWKIDNKEKVKEIYRISHKKNYQKNKDKFKEYRIKNREKRVKYFKEYNKTEKRAAAIKEHSKKRNLIPGVREKAIKACRYNRLFLGDKYIIERISRQFKIKEGTITKEMIILKRELLLGQRITKELKNVINR